MSETAKYVVGFMSMGGYVLLVRKLHPTWQIGLLNGVGGHVEAGESFDAAMVREFLEETGHNVVSWRHFAVLGGEGWTMHCYCTQGQIALLHGQQNDVGEVFEVVQEENIVRGHYDTIPNLRWLLPMTDPYDSKNWPYHIIERAGAHG